jgi:hypothetical protein
MYRKGIWLLEDAPKPFDNTKKFVHSSWLNQFRSDSDNKFLEELANLFNKLKDN